MRATRRAYQPSREAAGLAHTRSGRPLARLSAVAMVARVVATRESSEMGIAAPARQASMNSSSSGRWPLSWPPRALVVLALLPDQTVARPKLSSRALLPPDPASSVSLGNRVLPVVT